MSDTYRTNPAVEFDVERSAAGARTVASVGTDELEKVPVAATRVLPILERAFEPRTEAELVAFAVEEVGLSEVTARETVESLSADGLLLSDPEAVARRDEWLSKGWNTSLRYNFASRDWGITQSLAGEGDGRTVDARNGDAQNGVERDDDARNDDAREIVALPDPAPLPDRPVNDVLLSRRTCREFDGTPTTSAELGSLLGRAFRPVREGRERGGYDYFGTENFPLVVYPVVVRADDLDPAVYRYRVADHELGVVERLPDDPAAIDDALQEIVVNQPYARDAGVVFLLAADLDAYRARNRGEAAFRQLLATVSGQAHRLLLSATAAGLNAFQSAAMEDSTADEFVGADGYDEAVLYFVAVGRKAENDGSAGETEGDDD